MTHTDNPASTSVVSSAHGDLPSFYRNRMTQVALLTKEQELEIFQRLEQSETKLRELEGNPGADAMDRDRLVKQADETRKAIAEANLRLVTSIAGKFVNSELPIHDLIQEGNIGLMTAIGKFEYRRGNKLSTYATMLIRQAIIHAIERQEHTIRISGKMLGMIRKVEVVSKRLAWEYGYEPSLEEIADEIQLPVERVQKLQMMACRTTSLNAPVGDSDGACFGDSLVDESAGNPMENADRLISAHRLKQVFGLLTEREREVIKQRFGLRDGSCRTLGEIACQLGVTSERVRQIETEALEKIRGFIEGRGLDFPSENQAAGNPGEVTSSARADQPAATAPMTHGNWFRLVIRSIKENANHHIWNNNGTWWCKFSLESDSGAKKRISKSLKTKDLDWARAIRDRLLKALHNASGRIVT